jgi:hypothetical protein
MSSKKKLAVLACAATAAVPAVVFGGSAIATHEPANKAAATANGVAEFDRSAVLLQERIKVSSPYDLILQLTSECSILTELTTGGAGVTNETAQAEGSVRMYITLDGKTVPISTADTDPDAEGTQNDDGRATFCNRVYNRTVKDTEGDGATDEEHDYIRTKNANAFNWLALDVGTTYDDPANGNNIIDVVVHAEYDTTATGRAVADAYVGRRSLIIEPTNASVHEQVTPTDTPEGATVIGLPTP